MAVFSSDTFSGTAGTELSAYNAAWSKQTGSTGSLQISAAGRIRCAANLGSVYQKNDAPASADYDVSLDIYSASLVSGARAGAAGRMQSGANTYYAARFTGFSGVQLIKLVAGTTTQIGSTGSHTFALNATHTIKLTMSGTSLGLYVDGTSKVSSTDSSITDAGRPGVYFLPAASMSDTTNFHGDNFSAEEVSSGSSGSLSVTESTTDTFSGAGNVIVSGSLSKTETTVDSFTSSGTVLVSGTLSITEINKDVFAASGGSGAITGTLSVTESGLDVFSCSGTILVSGSLTATESTSDTLSISGVVLISGTLGATEGTSDIFSATNVAPAANKTVNSKWLVSLGSTGGTVQLQMASDVNGVDVTLQEGLFFLKYRKI